MCVCIKTPLWITEAHAEIVDALLPTLLTVYAQVPPPTTLLPYQQYIIQSTAQQTADLLTLPHFSGFLDIAWLSLLWLLMWMNASLLPISFTSCLFFLARFPAYPITCLAAWLLKFRDTCLPSCLSLTVLAGSLDASCTRCWLLTLLCLCACLATVPSSHFLSACFSAPWDLSPKLNCILSLS